MHNVSMDLAFLLPKLPQKNLGKLIIPKILESPGLASSNSACSVSKKHASSKISSMFITMSKSHSVVIASD